ncbi:hypothetical protein B0T17DRAFT_516704 [Bombardia bombarda]|uniref:Uncharacterized protein n=1 Tax=Bombardia bombarda TaxID=252184 RepID=A0AA39XKA2_9PEZI|nr:hypothetical protein B0T17DRAFT_516704 [Bombardia bombarda]
MPRLVSTGPRLKVLMSVASTSMAWPVPLSLHVSDSRRPLGLRLKEDVQRARNNTKTLDTDLIGRAQQEKGIMNIAVPHHVYFWFCTYMRTYVYIPARTMPWPVARASRPARLFFGSTFT